MTTRCCPVANCGAAIPHTRLMCPAHWRRVPKDLAAEVNDAYRAWLKALRTEDLSLESVRQAGNRLTLAQHAAIRAVNEKVAAG